MASELLPQPGNLQRRRRGRWLQALALLAPAAVGLYLAGGPLWVRYHRHSAEQALARGDLLAARQNLQTCLAVQKHDPDLHYLLAQTDRRAGRLDDAAADLKECEQLEGLSSRVLLESALLRLRTNELDAETEGFLWQLIQQGGSALRPICETLVPFYIARYDYHKAGPCLDLWLQHEPGAVPALIMRGQTYEALGAHTRAIDDCRKALRLDPESDQARLQLANLLGMDNKMDEVAALLEQVRQHQPQDATVLLGLARCRYQAGQVQDAEQLLKELLSYQPNLAAALRELGRIALDAGRVDDARRWLNESLAQDPHERDTLFFLSRCCRQQGQPAKADEYLARFQKVVDDLNRLKELAKRVLQKPDDPEPRYEAGVICLRNGQEQEALRWFDGALQARAHHRPTLQALSDYYKRIDKPDIAERYQARLAVSP